VHAVERELAIALAAVPVLGIAAVWASARLKLPPILLLLVAGLVAGPVTGIVKPVEQFGDLLFPVASLGVGLLLFEGGLGLRWSAIAGSRAVLTRLITVGAGVTWAIGAVSAYLFFDNGKSWAVLLGAILIVSGPTVVAPLLRYARPRDPAREILQWEGILIDPIGAMLAVLIVDAVRKGDTRPVAFLADMAGTGAVGVVAGLSGAFVVVIAFRRHWVPDQLQVPVALRVALAAFTAATLIALANQRLAPVGHVAEFGEGLGTLIVASLFVLLGASIDLGEVRHVLLPSLALFGVLVLVARPLAIVASTGGTTLGWRQRLYLMCLAPRGIVAAAVAALFAIELQDRGIDPHGLAPVTFTVIIGTVVLYGSIAVPAARLLRVARAPAKGVAIVGGQTIAVMLAQTLADAEVPVLLVTTSRREAAKAIDAGLLVYAGRLDSAELADTLEAVGVRQAVTLSRVEELNAYGLLRMVEALGRANVFRLPLDDADRPESNAVAAAAWGRQPFADECTESMLSALVRSGAGLVTRAGPIRTGDGELPLVRIDEQGTASIVSPGDPPDTPPGAKLVALVPAA
jgi:NhaP-type Na+/H+ or K+/H+ antiporter